MTYDLTSSGNGLILMTLTHLSRTIYIYSLYIYIYNLWLFNIAMENGPFIDGLPIKHGDFPWLC